MHANQKVFVAQTKSIGYLIGRSMTAKLSVLQIHQVHDFN